LRLKAGSLLLPDRGEPCVGRCCSARRRV